MGSHAARVAATACDDCARSDQARPLARPPREQQTAPGLSFGLNSLPSGTVHRRPPGPCPGSSRTVTDAGERRPALLESVLGATPQEFESPILRHADLQEHPSRPLAGQALTHTWAHLMGSFPGRGGCRCRYQPLRLCLVIRGITDRPRRKSARRRSVHPAVQGRPGPSATWIQLPLRKPRPANLQITSP